MSTVTKPRVVYGYKYGLLGGVSAQLRNRYPHFRDLADVRILFQEDHGSVASFPAGSAFETRSVDSQAFALQMLEPDLTVVIDSPSFLRAWEMAGKPGKLLLEVHTTTSNISYLNKLAHLHDDIAAVITVSDYMRERLTAIRQLEGLPFYIIPNCLTDQWFEEPTPVALEERPLLWVGKLDDHKRWRPALDIIDSVASEPGREDVRPLLVGGYTTVRSERIQALLAKLYSTKELARGSWWPYVEYARMPLVCRSVGAAGGGMLVTTRNESFGMAVAEALAMQCPVVAPAVGALPELLPEEAMYEFGDEAAARRLVGRMLDEPEYREALLSRRSEVLAMVQPARAVEAFKDVIDGVVGSQVSAKGGD